jgi:pilus assembly protein CpaB
VNRRKTTGIVASAVLAVLGALLLVLFLKGRGTTQAAVTTVPEPTVKVWVAKTDIAQGVTVESLRKDKLIEEKDMPKSQLSFGADTFAIDQMTNKITAQPIYQNDQLIEAKFQSTEEAVSSVIPSGQVAISLIIPAERMAGIGQQQNELVGIVATFGANGTSGNVSHIGFHKIQIIGKPVPWGAAAAAAAPAATPGQPAPAAPPYTGQMQVSLAVSAPDAERLVFLNQFGTLNLFREPQNAKEDGTRLVTFDNFYEQTVGSKAAPAPSTTVAGAPAPGAAVTPAAGVAATPAAKPGAPTTVAPAGGVALPAKPAASSTVVPTTIK